jgi:hypothetical protein
LQEAEKQVRMVRENLRVTQLRQKSYADHRRRELTFEVGDFVYLKVSPKEDLSYQEYPIKILETPERVTQNKKIKMSKVQWSYHTEDEAT